MNKTVLFIDGSNTHATAKALRLDIDYARVRVYYQATLLRAYYYTAVMNDDEGFVSIRPLVDWLAYNKFTVVSKPTKTYTDPLTGMTKIKGNMDIDISVQAMQLIPYIDHAVFFTGDGDFKPLLLAMQGQGVKCDVVSSIKTTPSMCADELRRTADEFFDLDDLRDEFVRLERPAVRPGKYG